MRKILSFALALLMVVGLAIPAVAAADVASVKNPGASEVKYTSLANAVKALGNGGTLTLLDDVSENLSYTVAKNASVTIEGNGHTLTGYVSLSGPLDVTAPGTVTVNNLKVASYRQDTFTVARATNVTLNDCELVNKAPGSSTNGNQKNVIALGTLSQITLNNVILEQNANKNFMSLTGLSTTINSTAFVNKDSRNHNIGTVITNLAYDETTTIGQNSSLTIDFPAQKELATDAIIDAIPADAPEAVVAVASDAIENGDLSQVNKQSQVKNIPAMVSSAIEAIEAKYAQELALAKNAATLDVNAANDADPLLLKDQGTLADAYTAIAEAESFTELEEVKSTAIANIQAKQAEELADAIAAAKIAIEAADNTDELNSSAVKDAGKKAVESGATKAEVAEILSQAIADVEAAVAQELADAKTAAKAAIDEQNAKDPLIDSSAVAAAYTAIDAATTKANVQRTLARQLGNVENAQEAELRDALEAARQSIHDQNQTDPVEGVADLAAEALLWAQFLNLDGSMETKADVAEELSSAIAALKAIQLTELNAEKAEVLAAVNAQNDKDPLIDSTAIRSAALLVDEAATKAAVRAIAEEAVQLVKDAQAEELAAAKEEALEVLSSANAVDPLIDTTPLDNANTAVENANTKAEVKQYKEAGVSNIAAQQAIELAAAKEAASSAIANGFNDARIYPEHKADLIANQQAAVDAAATKAAVADIQNSAMALIKAAEDNDVAAAKQIVIDELNTINNTDPITSTAVLSAAIDAVNACDTITGVVSASTGLYQSIRDEQALELADAKTAAKAALDAEEAKDALNDKTPLTDAKNGVDAMTTKALVEGAKSAGIASIQAAQARELQALQDEAIKAVRDEVKNDTNAKVLATADAEIAKIDATGKKAEVAPAKSAAIDAIIAMRQLVAAQEAAEDELNIAAGNRPSDAVKAIVSDGIAAIEAATTPAAVDTALTEALNKLYAQRAAEGLEKYCMLEGTELVDVTTDSTAVYVSNAAFSKFVKVTVDSNALTAADFTVVEGSTKVTLNAAYLKTLANGTHTIVIDSGDGIAKFTFTVQGQKPAPDTGDSTVWFVLVAAVAVLGLGATVVVLKKKKEDY